jgi:hypothetical protein
MSAGWLLPTPGGGLRGPHWDLTQIPFPYVPYMLIIDECSIILNLKDVMESICSIELFTSFTRMSSDLHFSIHKIFR